MKMAPSIICMVKAAAGPKSLARAAAFISGTPFELLKTLDLDGIDVAGWISRDSSSFPRIRMSEN